jgi:LacI family transcriptional regulator
VDIGRRLRTTHPGITAVFAIAQDISGKAATAVRMLLTSIESGKRPTAPVILDVRLVERASTAPPPTPAARHRPR